MCIRDRARVDEFTDGEKAIRKPCNQRKYILELTRLGTLITYYTRTGTPTCGTTILKQAFLNCGGINYDFGPTADAVLGYQIMRDYTAVSYTHLQDGMVPIPDVLMPKIGKKLQQGLEAIILNATWRDYLNIGSHHYTKPEELFKDQCVQMTILEATIIRSDLIRQVIQLYPLNKNTNYGLWQPIALFQYWSDKTVNVDSVVADIWSYNPWVTTSILCKKNTFKQWCELWYQNISSLPSKYNSCKKKVLKVRMSDFLPFSAMNLLAIRSVNGFDFKYIHTNRKILEKVSINPYWVFCIIAFMPRSLAGFFETHSDMKIIKLISKIYIALKSVMEYS